jgi:hypothetical protein
MPENKITESPRIVVGVGGSPRPGRLDGNRGRRSRPAWAYRL